MNSPSGAAERDLRNIAEKEIWMLDLLGVESQQPFSRGCRELQMLDMQNKCFSADGRNAERVLVTADATNIM
jgi:hypothetical protein